MDPKIVMYVNRVTEAIAKVNLEMGKIRSKVDDQANELAKKDDEIAELRSQLEEQGGEIEKLKNEAASPHHGESRLRELENYLWHQLKSAMIARLHRDSKKYSVSDKIHLVHA
ncbi:hypothetical protein FOZ63_001681, partial [Perkinsus olseni]